jgi:uncharacterized protein (DUF1330 family)
LQNFFNHGRENIMNRRITLALTALVSAALGAAAVHGLRAQAKPPVYYISEIDATNLDGYINEYVPIVQATIKASGGRQLAGGQNVMSYEGAPPTKRVALTIWDSAEQIQAWRSSAAYKQAREIGNKYAKFRSFSVEALPQ